MSFDSGVKKNLERGTNVSSFFWRTIGFKGGKGQWGTTPLTKVKPQYWQQPLEPYMAAVSKMLPKELCKRFGVLECRCDVFTGFASTGLPQAWPGLWSLAAKPFETPKRPQWKHHSWHTGVLGEHSCPDSTIGTRHRPQVASIVYSSQDWPQGVQ